MDLALNPNLSELRVYWSLIAAGEMFMISFVIELPPILYWRSLVSLESR